MTMIMFTGGGNSLKLAHAFFILLVLVHLRPALGFISGVGVGDANNIRCPERERQALLKFKKALFDDYGRLSSWRSKDKNCCNWKGVHCSNQTGHVLELHLSGDLFNVYQPLRGMISPSLLELPDLTFLDLSDNDFNQSNLPEFIGSLSNLKHLDLSSTNLSGPISHQLKNLSHLQFLNLRGNDLIIIENLEWLSHLPSIEYLDLTSVNLSVVHDWLEVVSHLSNLTTLSLWGCDLPSQMFSSLSGFNYWKSLTSLESLNLDTNNLVSLPKSIGDICTLRKLYFSYNNLNAQLVELINNLSRCAKDSLESLGLSSNQLTGSLPNFALFPSLKHLDLSKNILNGIVPKSIGSLYKLEGLDMSWNFLQGTLSEPHFSNLSKLSYLDLSNNSLALEFNVNWVPPFQLKMINLKSCKLGPRFPSWIQTQRSVSVLKISNAKISDTIPIEWFADLPPTLEFLDLSGNRIHGRLPNVSTMNSNGIGFDLSGNSLEGPLPLFTANLKILKLSKNRFSGSISCLCKINGRSLTYLDLSDNLFYGQLPNCFRHWHELVVLNLAGNKFSGEVPNSLGRLSNLETLKLYNNSFSGNFPSSLKNCSSLKVIDLGDNRFSGEVPAWIGEGLPWLIVLILRSNKFEGSIPLNLCWLAHLQTLDLSLNEISGTIPSCLNNFIAMAQKRDYSNDYITSSLEYFSYVGNYTSAVFYVDSVTIVSKGREDEYGNNLGLLIMINLSGNKLIGNLPIEISSLLELVTLNVSRNNLSGEIPHLIGQLKMLETLDLSRNQFSGEIPLSMSELSFLNHLDLSYNHLSGKIPSSTQLQSFIASDFAGNPGLCGLPLSQKCWASEQTPNQSEDGEEYRDEFWKWFYGAAGFGFVVGFLGVCSSLLLKDSWRYAYFLSLENMKDCLYVTIAVNMARLWRTFQRPG